MNKVEWNVPSNLEEIPKFLFFDLYQLCLFITFLCIGMLFGYLIFGGVIGFLLSKAYGRFMANKPARFIMHLAYWYLPYWVINLKRSPPAYLRFFVG